MDNSFAFGTVFSSELTVAFGLFSILVSIEQEFLKDFKSKLEFAVGVLNYIERRRKLSSKRATFLEY